MLEPSVLVHETYLRLAANPPDSWTSTEHFLAVAAGAMRRVLIDHARRRRALKRGFGRSRVALELVSEKGAREVDIRQLDDALRRLAAIDPRAAQIRLPLDRGRDLPLHTPPTLGQHTEEILRDAGFTPEEIQVLVRTDSTRP